MINVEGHAADCRMASIIIICTRYCFGDCALVCARLGCSRGIDDKEEGGRKATVSAADRTAPEERKHNQGNKRLRKEGGGNPQEDTARA